MAVSSHLFSELVFRPSSFSLSLLFSLPPGYAHKPQALPQRADGETGDHQIEMGDGVQRLPGLYGQLHEHTGSYTVLDTHTFTNDKQLRLLCCRL